MRKFLIKHGGKRDAEQVGRDHVGSPINVEKKERESSIEAIAGNEESEGKQSSDFKSCSARVPVHA